MAIGTAGIEDSEAPHFDHMRSTDMDIAPKKGEFPVKREEKNLGIHSLETSLFNENDERVINWPDEQILPISMQLNLPIVVSEEMQSMNIDYTRLADVLSEVKVDALEVEQSKMTKVGENLNINTKISIGCQSENKFEITSDWVEEFGIEKVNMGGSGSIDMPDMTFLTGKDFNEGKMKNHDAEIVTIMEGEDRDRHFCSSTLKEHDERLVIADETRSASSIEEVSWPSSEGLVVGSVLPSQIALVDEYLDGLIDFAEAQSKYFTGAEVTEESLAPAMESPSFIEKKQNEDEDVFYSATSVPTLFLSPPKFQKSASFNYCSSSVEAADMIFSSPQGLDSQRMIMERTKELLDFDTQDQAMNLSSLVYKTANQFNENIDVGSDGKIETHYVSKLQMDSPMKADSMCRVLFRIEKYDTNVEESIFDEFNDGHIISKSEVDYLTEDDKGTDSEENHSTELNSENSQETKEEEQQNGLYSPSSDATSEHYGSGSLIDQDHQPVVKKTLDFDPSLGVPGRFTAPCLAKEIEEISSFDVSAVSEVVEPNQELPCAPTSKASENSSTKATQSLPSFGTPGASYLEDKETTADTLIPSDKSHMEDRKESEETILEQKKEVQPSSVSGDSSVGCWGIWNFLWEFLHGNRR
ncbi:uncharacterized protein LOC18435601 isoform X2 [Amborella trichopoda]|uniref:uncharacterized protein LOC18435601 isoform X2 n=1 Tax=Amborella trichopoda TaxID=13333 RepID=UPI0009BFCF27|nr:uncharacterized protein LOC18435601 isoform X2 [Amborella trichopoda]|eukprot:XP_020523800.1 uncharacterized protein LOC18435601 isoform X2 [Amborella trichopoda]